ncbi:MAG: cytochrome c-type biogenesis protein CcmF [Saprospiraceae bacterium]|jgi:cytochrome c-type biogenesis protein CcmF
MKSEYVEYINEHLFIGTIGHVLMICSFVAIVFSSISYFLSAQNGSDAQWLKVGKWLFRIHSFTILSLVGLLFYMLLNNMYEYHYVFKHSNDVMPLRYILSCFWAGQEGSFLLWIICHVLLGNVLQLTSKSWEPHVMAIFGLMQMFLVGMLLGVNVSGGAGIGLLVTIILLVPTLLFIKKLTLLEGFSYLAAAIVIGILFSMFPYEGFTLGSNPFVLLTRDSETFARDTLFFNKNYTDIIQGQGLNPLLQNYWMTIHPPTLFVGFASTLIPFCYAIAGLWTRKFNDWMAPVLPWMFFGIMVLGVGVLMGGAWAYESLTFGGFWAWDPVENASLFPWLTFVGAAHVMMIQKKKGESSYMTFLLTIFSFVFVIYSTYLTRSGVLAETSVHSFASGGSGQILFFLFFVYWLGGIVLLQNKVTRTLFTGAAAGLYWLNLIHGNTYWVNILFVVVLLVLFVWDYLKFFDKGKNEEDNLSSREFWMFMGAILLLLSCFQLIFKTSLPVFNGVFGLDKVLNKTDIVSDYAVPQMIIGSFISLVLGFSLFLKYKKTPSKPFFKYTLIALISSVTVVLFSMYFTDFDFGESNSTKILYPIFFTFSLFAVLGNLYYFIFVLKGKFKNAGSSIAHFGFGLILLGSFISTSQSEVVSVNTSDADLELESQGELLNSENLKIVVGDTLPLGDYWVSYVNKYQEGVNIYYDIEYYKDIDGVKKLDFTLTPFIQINATFGRVAEPDTRHYLLHDLYTHLTSAISDTTTKKEYKKFALIKMKRDSSVVHSDYKFVYKEVATFKTEENADSMVLRMMVTNPQGREGLLELPMVLYKNKLYPIPNANYEVGVAGEWIKADPATETFEMYLSVMKPEIKDFVVLKAINFPLINMLWLGCVVMALGTFMSVVKRVKSLRKLKQPINP